MYRTKTSVLGLGRGLWVWAAGPPPPVGHSGVTSHSMNAIDDGIYSPPPLLARKAFGFPDRQPGKPPSAQKPDGAREEEQAEGAQRHGGKGHPSVECSSGGLALGPSIRLLSPHSLSHLCMGCGGESLALR